MIDYQNIPAKACLFSAEVEFGDNGEGAKSVPITMKARSGQPIEHPFWGRVVHDMEGMTLHRKRLPVDYAHGEEIGYLNHFENVNEGLTVSGALVPTSQPNDPALKVIARQRGGVPYEASINFGGDGIRIQEVGEGEVASVNGYQFEGPGVIFRMWPLRGVAVCPYGADMNTESLFNKADTFSAQLLSKESVMPEATPPVEAPVTPAAVETPAVQDTPVEAATETPAAVETTSAPPAATELSQERTEAKRFCEAFGEQGAVWFAQGVAFDACYKLSLDAMRKELAELRQKLSVGKVDGETSTVEFQATDKPAVKGGFASRLKFAGSAS